MLGVTRPSMHQATLSEYAHLESRQCVRATTSMPKSCGNVPLIPILTRPGGQAVFGVSDRGGIDPGLRKHRVNNCPPAGAADKDRFAFSSLRPQARRPFGKAKSNTSQAPISHTETMLMCCSRANEDTSGDGKPTSDSLRFTSFTAAVVDGDHRQDENAGEELEHVNVRGVVGEGSRKPFRALLQ